jgi:catechol 2,3-dioxygenase-like lactoylglutathione lyase family enzyme
MTFRKLEIQRVTIRRIHHVQITVPKDAEAAARAFYCGVMQLVEVEKPDGLKARGGIWVAIGDQQLHIGVEDGVIRRATKAHVAYEVDDLPQWRDRQAAAKVSIAESIPIPHCDRLEFRDPFNNRIELIQQTPR